MQKEIDRLNDLMSKNSGNMQQELNQRDLEIAKLTKRIQELEKELNQVKNEKEAEAEKFAGEKGKYEAKIKDLEDQIRMLRNESGDVMQELERKMQMLIESHERERGEMDSEHKSAL